MSDEISADSIMQAWALRDRLLALGFSSRTANALAYNAELENVEQLRSATWGNGEPGSGLLWVLRCSPRIGIRAIAEVEGFRRGEPPSAARLPRQAKVTASLSEAELSELDAYREALPDKPSRPEALRRKAFKGDLQ